MTDLSEFYKAYGEGLASRLADIAYSESNKTFCFVEDVGSPTEVISFNFGPNPVLVWEDFEEDIETAGRDNYYSQIVGSMAVMSKAGGSASKAGKREVYRQNRAILLKAIALMIQDSESGELADQDISMEIRKFPCQKIGPVGGDKYGYGIQFTWLVPVNLTLTESDVLYQD
ncbi:hypothetical protein [Spirosoma oryzicola]|uniref:hypothetical protein n=1 Tax=Spirosoma oryzicola TaxID=2898794 RepID=UPI001E3FE6F8|nr:hypothetical protein [Spirosoma oryzicola]UHG93433.1 hypothetical protein LQ777_11125 [Spirosoma oryzicola]